MISSMPKKLPLNFLKLVKHDARSTTGSNLRNMMLLLGKVNTSDISAKDLEKFEYVAVKPEVH
jgi:hypothetical protein